jgi:hypothetical protein
MITAMQEHFEWLQENQLYFGIPIEAIDNAEDLLEKEKEQIMFSYHYGKTNGILNNKTSEQFYNQTYKNQ